MTEPALKRIDLKRIKAILLDRDGTINVERAEYVRTQAEFALLPNAEAALAKLARLNLPVGIVTNQAGIGRGLIDPRAVDAIHAHLAAIARRQGLTIGHVAICPHRADEGCGCRKPQPGLIHEAAEALGVSAEECLVIGDSLTDALAARAAGSMTLLVRTGRLGNMLESLCWQEDIDPASILIVDDLLDAAEWLLSELRPTQEERTTAQLITDY